MVSTGSHRYLSRAAGVLAAILSLAGSARGAEEDAPPAATNLEVIQSLASGITDSVVTLTGAEDSLALLVMPRDEFWYIEGAMFQALRSRGLRPTLSPSAAIRCNAGVLQLTVRYENIRRRGFLGARVVDRIVSLVMSMTAIRQSSGSVLWQGSLMRSARDTVQVSEVDRLENASISATKAVLPSEGFFASLAEPLIAIGALGVAIYLLFHVRS